MRWGTGIRNKEARGPLLHLSSEYLFIEFESRIFRLDTDLPLVNIIQPNTRAPSPDFSGTLRATNKLIFRNALSTWVDFSTPHFHWPERHQKRTKKSNDLMLDMPLVIFMNNY